MTSKSQNRFKSYGNYAEKSEFYLMDKVVKVEGLLSTGPTLLVFGKEGAWLNFRLMILYVTREI